MRFVEPHLHADFATTHDMLSMSVAGVEAVIFLGKYVVDPLAKPGDLFKYLESLFTYYKERAENLGIKVFTGLSMPVIGLSKDEVKPLYSRLRDMLGRQGVVAIGETGLEWANDDEVEKLKAQFAMAKEMGLPVVCHTPIPRATHKLHAVKKILELVKETSFPPDKLVIEHGDEETLKVVLETRSWTALSTCFDKLTPKEVALIAKQLLEKGEGADRIMVNSEYGWGYQGYYSVPRVAFEMKLLGIKTSEIERLTFENPVKFYGLKL